MTKKSGRETSARRTERKTEGDRSGGSPPPFVSGEVPLYYQLATVLREKILSRQYQPEDQMPTEADLVRDYGVSRITVRQAMGKLEEAGLIRREAGRGTFVTDHRPATGTLELDQSIDELISMGKATSVQLLELEGTVASPEVADELGLEGGAPLVRCKRLRMYEGRPYCYIVNLMPEEIGRRVQRRAWKRGSVLAHIEEDLGIPLRIAQQRVRAVLADAQLARWLDARIGAPVLRVDYIIRTDRDRPVEKAELYYRGDIYSFTLHLVRSDDDKGESWSLQRGRFEH